MKVILLEDIENLGKKFEIKDLKEGYVRNFLLPKKLVKIATLENLKWREEQIKKEKERIQSNLEKIGEIASKIDGLEVEIPVKVGEKGQLFEKITPQKISNFLKKQGFDINKNQIILKNPIEELGEFKVKIKFEHNLEAEILVLVVKQENQK